jgi:hypothetical protein
MPTLKSMASVTTGLYRDTSSGRAYGRDDLLSQLSADLLGRPIRLERTAQGVYRIHIGNGDRITFEVWSRRRAPR